MCGIAGILNYHGSVSVDQITAMNDSLAHRGPDGEGYYVDKQIGLGHRRLAIIDLSLAGKQPMQTEDNRFIITYNGEIYNFQELRSELLTLGCKFNSKTDSEVVLHAYAKWGENCVKRFNGMFAFAIWDKTKQTLFLARDRYGIKPLYYYKNDNYFIFASEIKAIIASNLYRSELDKEGLVEYLTFQNFFTDKTLFKDIKILPAGHYAEVDLNKKMIFTKYWDFNFQTSLHLTEDEATEELDRLFCQAVTRQLVSDVDVNTYLSGGIDSGAITMIASRYVPHLRTFTIGFDLSSAAGLELAFDERRKAEHLSYLAKTEHYQMVLKAGDMERCMDSLVQHLEEPRVGQSYPNFYAAKLASKFGKVVLGGTGGDELFAGYPWRYFYNAVPKRVDEFIDEYYLKWQRLVPNSVLQTLLSPILGEIKHVWTRDIFADIFEGLPKTDTLNSPEETVNHSLYLEAKTFLHGLLIMEDKLSMSHGLETRVPFLDNDLVDYALKLPLSYKLDMNSGPLIVDENRTDKKQKVKAKNGKRILRKCLARYVPDYIAEGDKQGFSAPDASWFKGESIEFVKRNLNNSSSLSGQYLNSSVIEDIINTHASGKSNNRLVLWSFIYLEKFLNRFTS